jgi:hypothetical protein
MTVIRFGLKLSLNILLIFVNYILGIFFYIIKTHLSALNHSYSSLRESHILAKTDLDPLPADCPILNVITIPEVITLGIIPSFQDISRSLGSKGFPDIIRHLALLCRTSRIHCLSSKI